MIRFVFSAFGGIVLLSSTASSQSSDGTIATGIDFELEAAVVPAVEKYSHCLNTHRPIVINGEPTLLAATETAIAACKDARVAAMAEADAALARMPGWESKAKRDAEVIADFDNTDASARKLARDTEAFLARNGGRPK